MTNAEQLSFLFFFYLVEGIDAKNLPQGQSLATNTMPPVRVRGRVDAEKPAECPQQGHQKTIPRDRFRWSVWAKGLSGEEALSRFVRDEVFAFFDELGDQITPINFMARGAADD